MYIQMLNNDRHGFDVQGPNRRLVRPNKLAAGMTYTALRSGHNLSEIAGRLSVNGTTAKHSIFFGPGKLVTIKNPITGRREKKYILSDRKKLRLSILRRKYKKILTGFNFSV